MLAVVFKHTHRVTYAECAPGNHVYYARYLDILESARGELFRKLGRTFREWQEQGTIFPVIECHVSYKSAARYDDPLTIETRVTLAEGTRLNFAYRVMGPAGALILEAETFHICAGINEKPKRLPEDLRALLAR